MLNSDFAARWRLMEKRNGARPCRLWHQLPNAQFAFLRADEAAFLRGTGLPDDAPCFCLEEVNEGLPRVDEMYGPDDAKLWARVGREKMAAFRMLGDDGGGNHLVLNIETREVWLLDHENDFALGRLVNSNLEAFVESLLLFGQAQYPAPEVDVEAVLRALAAVDARAAQDDAFWHHYAHDLHDVI